MTLKTTEWVEIQHRTVTGLPKREKVVSALHYRLQHEEIHPQVSPGILMMMQKKDPQL